MCAFAVRTDFINPLSIMAGFFVNIGGVLDSGIWPRMDTKVDHSKEDRISMLAVQSMLSTHNIDEVTLH